METLTKSDNAPWNISMSNKTLVVGSDGFIGRHFLKAYQKNDPTTFGTTIDTLNICQPTLKPFDLTGVEYALIVAALPRIAQCEQEKELTRRVNLTGTLELVQQLIDKRITPILFSTDYVFDGIAGNYNEESPLNPLNEYGRQKAELQKELPKICGDNFLLIRPSKVFGHTSGDGTLLDEMVTHLRLEMPIRAARDQFFSPLSITDLINGVIALQNKQSRGVFHICGTKCSRFEIGQAIARRLSSNMSLVQSISLDDLKDAFQRPKDTSMICDKFNETTGIKIKPVMNYIEEGFK